MGQSQQNVSAAKTPDQSIGDLLRVFNTGMQGLGPAFQAPSPSQVATGQAGFPNIQYDPSRTPGSAPTTAPPPGFVPYQGTGSQSINNFSSQRGATNAGMVSLGNSILGLVNTFEQRDHEKKVMQAQNLMQQVTDFHASGDPGDDRRAISILEDPKNRKILKEGLGYVPYQEKQEPPPPEAIGVQKALARAIGLTGGNPSMTGQVTTPGQIPSQNTSPNQMMPPPNGGMRTVLPQPTAAAQFQSALMNAATQKLKNDPSSALGMMGVSQLSSVEQRASEFYEKGLGVSPADVQKMDMAQKMEGIKAYSALFQDLIKQQFETEKFNATQAGLNKRAGAANQNKLDIASMLSGVKERIATEAQNAKGNANVVAEKMYRDEAAKADIRSQTANISDEEKKMWLDKSQELNFKADAASTKAGDEDMMKAILPYFVQGLLGNTTEETPIP